MSDLDRDLKRGRLRNLGKGDQPDDAARIQDVIDIVQSAIKAIPPPKVQMVVPTPLPRVAGGGGPGGGGGKGPSIARRGPAITPIVAGGNSIVNGLASFVDSNGVSFGVLGNSITASVSPGGVAISAGAQSADTGTVAFQNSNGISFGMAGFSAVTAQGDFVRSISAGTTVATGNGISFQDGNGVSFGVAGATITASVAPPAGSVVFSAGTTSNTLTNVVFSNQNNVSFGLVGSTITASASFPSDVILAISAGTTSVSTGTVAFSNSNNVTFGLNGSTLTATVASSLTNVNVSAGTTSNNLSAITFQNANNVTFGLAGSVLTASASSPSDVPFAISAGTQSASSGTVLFSNSNGVTFGLNASTVTASIATSLTNINVSAGTTSNNLSQVVFSNSNNVSFGLNASTITATVASSLTNINVSAGTTSNNLSQVVFSNSNNISFGLSGSTVTATAQISSVTLSLWENLSGVMFQGSTFNTFSVVPLSPLVFPGVMTAKSFLLGMNGVGSQSTQPGTMLFSFGIYTLNASTLSLLNSAATSVTYAAASNNSVVYSGFRWLSLDATQFSASLTFSQTHYWLGYIVSSSNQTQSLMMVGQNFANAQGRFGTMGVTQTASAGSLGWTPFMGAYSVTTSQLPPSVVQSDLNAGATSVGNFLPQVILNNVMGSF